MIRLRSQKLLSGVSGLAVLASFGLVSPALAAPTYPGPATYDPITNDQTGVNSTVVIGADATVRAAAGTNDSFFNNLNMSGTGAKFTITDSFLLGDIENSGSVVSSDNDALFIGADSQIGGRIFNNGTLQGLGGGGQGIDIDDDSTVAGGIFNTGGAILGSVDGIFLHNDSEIFNGITNTGSINGGSDGIDIEGVGTEFWGGITNSGSITTDGGAATDAAIEFSNGLFNGGIANTGYIGSPVGNGTGIGIHSGQFNGNITNNTGGVIEGRGAGAFAGIAVTGGTITSSIVNNAIIRGVAGANAIEMSGGTLTGNITNNSGALISATAASVTAILISGGTITGNITNTGQILGTGNNGNAIVVSGATTDFNGNIVNNTGGLISSDDTAILISNATFDGSITNDGSIRSDDNDGILITTTTSFIGDVVNNGVIVDGTGAVGDDGIDINTVLFTGTVTNAGVIRAGDDGIIIDGTTFTGNLNNSGNVTAVNNAVQLTGTTFAGNVTNSGGLTAGNDALRVDAGTTVTGTLTNQAAGVITSTGQDAVDINGIVNGPLVNAGIIDGFRDGVDIDGQIDGGVTNTGTIKGRVTGIDASGANTLTTITQTAGLIQGRTADNLTITNALDLSNAFADTFNANGGTLDGNVVVNATDDFIMNPSGTFTWRRGVTTGTLDQFDMNGGGTAILGATSRGDATGEGVTVNAATMTFGGEGTIYLDDDTTINAGTFSQTDGTLEFFVTSDETTHNYINSGAALSQTNVRGAAYIDPNTMALGGGQSVYVYDDVINATGARTGALPNGGTITTSSIFFTGTFTTNDADDLDITLNRLAFDAALAAAGATESQNQQAVAAALEEIYDNGFISPEMESVFIDLFAAGLTPAQIQFILNELSGSEIAQAEQVSLSVANIFNNLVEERLDSGLLSLGGTRMSALAQQRYADAGTTATDGSHGMTRGGSGMSVWARGFGQWVNVDTDPEADGYDQDSNGLVGGLDYAPNANAMVGGAVAYTDTDVDFDEPGDTADVESWQVGLYGSYGFGKFYVDGMASYGWHDVTAQRTISLPSNTYLASSAYDASAWSVQGELGAIWRLGRVNMQPSVALGYTGADRDGFSETVSPTAPGIGLVVGGSDSDSLATTLALRASGEWMMGKTQVVPDIKLGWRHEFEDGRQDFTANFFEDLSPAASMTIVSSEIQADSLVVSTGATFGVTKNFEVFIDVNGQYNADASATNASGGVRLTW